MKITLLCSDVLHPVNYHLNKWIKKTCDIHEISLVRRKSELAGGDILFLVSCADVIKAVDRRKYRTCLVLHASDLPHGRGWSPHVWEIINGAEQITVSLLEAGDKVDSGRIWKKISIPVPKHAMWDEINGRLFEVEIELIDFAIEAYYRVEPQEQSVENKPTHYRRRTPEDSRLDPDASIADQFNQIRVCDPHRFPAFFDLYGQRYKLILEKVDEKSVND